MFWEQQETGIKLAITLEGNVPKYLLHRIRVNTSSLCIGEIGHGSRPVYTITGRINLAVCVL